MSPHFHDHAWEPSVVGDPRLWICPIPPDKPVPGGRYQTCPCGAACTRDAKGRIEIYDTAPRAAEPSAAFGKAPRH